MLVHLWRSKGDDIIGYNYPDEAFVFINGGSNGGVFRQCSKIGAHQVAGRILAEIEGLFDMSLG